MGGALGRATMSSRCPSRSFGSPKLRFVFMATALAFSACTKPSSKKSEAVAPPAPTAPIAAKAAGAPEPKPAPRMFKPRAGCKAVPVFVAGEQRGSLCETDAAKEGLTVVDLSDTWTPRVFAPDAKTGDAPEYRAKYLELASQPNGDL